MLKNRRKLEDLTNPSAPTMMVIGFFFDTFGIKTDKRGVPEMKEIIRKALKDVVRNEETETKFQMYLYADTATQFRNSAQHYDSDEGMSRVYEAFCDRFEKFRAYIRKNKSVANYDQIWECMCDATNEINNINQLSGLKLITHIPSYNKNRILHASIQPEDPNREQPIPGEYTADKCRTKFGQNLSSWNVIVEYWDSSRTKIRQMNAMFIKWNGNMIILKKDDKNRIIKKALIKSIYVSDKVPSS